MENLSERDVLTFLGKANNLNENGSNKKLTYILQFVKKNTNSNIILSTVPYQHDLVVTHKMNEQTLIFNRKLRKYIKPNRNVTILPVDEN